MRIRNVLHKGLRRFIEDDDKSGIQAAVAEKLRRMISFLQDMEKETELKAMPNWKAHQLTGDRKGTWSLFGHQELAADVSDRPNPNRNYRS
jgi:proteic killer suppression protein